MRPYKFIVFLSIVILSWAAPAQDQPGISENQYENLREDYDYSEISPSEDIPRERPERKAKSDGSNLFMWKVLIYIISGGVFVLVIYAIWQHQKNNASVKNEKLKEAVTIEEAENNLLDVHLGQLIRDAANNNDLRALLHLNFLELLRQLHNQGAIKWEPHKTNGRYYLEISDNTMKSRYLQIWHVFDRVWYGMKPISQTAYEQWLNETKLLGNEQ